MEKNNKNITLTTAEDFSEFIEKAYQAYMERFGGFTFNWENHTFKSRLRERCEWLHNTTVKVGQRFTEHGMEWKEIEMDIIDNEQNGILVVSMMPLGGFLFAFGFYLNDDPSGRQLYEVTLHESDGIEKVYTPTNMGEFVGYINGVIEYHLLLNKALGMFKEEESVNKTENNEQQ